MMLAAWLNNYARFFGKNELDYLLSKKRALPELTQEDQAKRGNQHLVGRPDRFNHEIPKVPPIMASQDEIINKRLSSE